ncbi:PEP/pyruvate-binding domain-containing protein [Nonomuraea ferruginea]
MSGAVNPDRFVADARTGEIRERRAGDKRLLVRALPGGGTERLDTPPRDGFCLTDEQVRELAALGARVEEHYGAPQDTEWAIGADGGLWLTQARPITTLYPLPEPRDGLRVFFSRSTSRRASWAPSRRWGRRRSSCSPPAPPAAFGRPPADPREGPPVLVSAGERLWIDITTPLRSRAGRVILPRVMQVGEARTVALVRELAADPRLPVTHTSRRPLLRAAAHFGRRLRVPAKVLRALTRPERALAYTRKLGEDLDGHLRLPETATPADRLRHAQRMLGGAFPAIVSIMPTALTGYGLYALAARLSGTPLGEMQEVLRSVPNNPTTEMDLELWRLATRIEPEVFRREPVAELVRRYRADDAASRRPARDHRVPRPVRAPRRRRDRHRRAPLVGGAGPHPRRAGQLPAHGRGRRPRPGRAVRQGRGGRPAGGGRGRGRRAPPRPAPRRCRAVRPGPRPAVRRAPRAAQVLRGQGHRGRTGEPAGGGRPPGGRGRAGLGAGRVLPGLRRAGGGGGREGR